MLSKIMVCGKWLLLAVFVAVGGWLYCHGRGQGGGTALSTAALTGSEAGSSLGGLGQEEQIPSDAKTPLETGEEPVACYVHVCGEVRRPGVYQLAAGSRIYEAVELAGGFTENAAPDFINLAEPISDGMKVDVPDVQRAEAVSAMEPSPGEADDGRVNINTADRALLMTLTGIGEARADAIILYREEHGSFSAIEDIMRVPGIKDAAFQKIKEKIKV